MIKQLLRTVFFVAILSQLPLPLLADHVDITWPLSNQDDLGAQTMTAGADDYLTPSFALGSNLVATGVNAEADTVRTTRLAAGAVIPAGAAVLYLGTPGDQVKFVPSAKSPASVNKTYLKGAPVDSVLTSDEAADELLYTLQPVAETGGVAFVRVADGTRVEAGTPWLRVKGTATAPALSQYYVTRESIPTGVGSPEMADPESENGRSAGGKATTSFDLSGKPIAQPRQGELIIVNGKKFITN